MSGVQIQHINFWACFCSNMNGKSRTHCLTKWEARKIGAYLLYKHEWEVLHSLYAPHVNACDIYRLIEGST